MSYGEWCPQCGAEIISVTRGIPSMGACANGHVTDRRDTLRRKPEPAPDLAARVVRLTEALAFYADPEIYKPHPHGLGFDRRDLSYVARAALGEQK